MLFSANDFAAASSVQDFDLSQNNSLQELRITVGSIDRAISVGYSGLRNPSQVLKYALLTIRSPMFSRVVLVHEEHSFRGVDTRRTSEWPHLHEMSQSARGEEASRYRKRFELLREVHKLRDFQLVLCANVWGPVGDYTLQMLREAVAAERENGRLYGSFSGPLVTYNPHWDLRY